MFVFYFAVNSHGIHRKADDSRPVTWMSCLTWYGPLLLWFGHVDSLMLGNLAAYVTILTHVCLQLQWPIKYDKSSGSASTVRLCGGGHSLVVYSRRVIIDSLTYWQWCHTHSKACLFWARFGAHNCHVCCHGAISRGALCNKCKYVSNVTKSMVYTFYNRGVQIARIRLVYNARFLLNVSNTYLIPV